MKNEESRAEAMLRDSLELRAIAWERAEKAYKEIMQAKFELRGEAETGRAQLQKIQDELADWLDENSPD